MKPNVMMHILFLCSFSFLQSMESTIINRDLPVSDKNLQKLITAINDSSFNIVTIVKKSAQDDYVQLNSHTIKSVLNINQSTIDQIFLTHVEDDELRPLMLAAGANINTKTLDNRNCLWYTKKPALLKELIGKGATVDLVDSYNKTRLIDLLAYLDFVPDPHENIAAASVLLNNSANPNTVFESDKVLLHAVAQCKQLILSFETIKLLCDYKANTNVKNREGDTPLIIMVRKGLFTHVKCLLDGKADPNICNIHHQYPLHIALHQLKTNENLIYSDIVILLLERKANPNIPYLASKNRPLHIAVLTHNWSIIKKLIECGAEKHHLDDCGHTAFETAQKLEHYDHLTKEIVDLLNPNPCDLMTFTVLDFVPQEKINNNSTSKNDENCSLQ